MTGQRWLLAIATLFVLMAVLVFGWLGLAQVEHRNNLLSDAMTAQKLRVAPVTENARIVSSILFGELQLALRTSPASAEGGREQFSEVSGLTRYLYDRPRALRKSERELLGSLLTKGTPGSTQKELLYRRTLAWLLERDLNLMGRSWSAAFDRSYFLSRDGTHALAVPAWSSDSDSDFRARQMLDPFPGDIKNGERQMMFTEAWIDPTDGKARQTIAAPVFDEQGVWLGNAGVDFRLSTLDEILASSPLAAVEWMLVSTQNMVLSRSVDSRGEFAKLTWGTPLSQAVVPLPAPEDGIHTEAGRYTVLVQKVPGSTLYLYGIVPTAWVAQDLPLVIGVGLAVIVMLIGAFSFIGWLQRRNELNVRRATSDAQTQVALDRARRDSESDIKDYLAGVSANVHQVTTREDFTQEVLASTTAYVGADYGAFYWMEDAQSLVPLAGHGVLVSELARIKVGQGLLGEAAKSQKPIQLIGGDFAGFRVMWGQGPLEPSRVDLLPVVQNEVVLGVIVLAFLQKPETDHQAFYDALLPSVAINLEIQKRNLATAAQAKALERQQSILQETEAWSRGIIESSPDGMLVVDANGTILMTNRQAEAIFGYAPGELIGQAIESLVPDSVRPRHSTLRGGFISSDAQRAQMGIGSRDLRAVCKDGREIHVEVGLTKLPQLADSGTCVCAWVKPVLTS